jgi:plastocyanin
LQVFIRAALLIALLFGSSACEPTPTPTPTPAPAGQVSIQGQSYQPNFVSVKVGGTVTWTNADSVPHTVTADATLEEFASNLLSPGDVFTQTFTHPGTFLYHCVVHSTMHGTVRVST